MNSTKKIIYLTVIIIPILWIGGYLAFIIHVNSLEPYMQEQKTDAIVVLTGGHNRIDTGLELLTNGMSGQLFITGVHNLVKDDEIRAMWNGDKPLPDCCITLGRDATSTIGNATETRRWIEKNNIRTIRLVTSQYHMPRALMEFKYMLNDTEIIPHPVIIKYSEENRIKYLSLTFGEYNKTIFRYIILVINQLRPA